MSKASLVVLAMLAASPMAAQASCPETGCKWNAMGAGMAPGFGLKDIKAGDCITAAIKTMAGAQWATLEASGAVCEVATTTAAAEAATTTQCVCPTTIAVTTPAAPTTAAPTTAAPTTAAPTTAAPTTAAGNTTAAPGTTKEGATTTAVPVTKQEVKGTMSVGLDLGNLTADDFVKDENVKTGFAAAIANQTGVDPSTVTVTITVKASSGGGRRLAATEFVITYVILVPATADSATLANNIKTKISAAKKEDVAAVFAEEIGKTESKFKAVPVTVNTIEAPSVKEVATTTAKPINFENTNNGMRDRVAILTLLSMFLSLWQ